MTSKFPAGISRHAETGQWLVRATKIDPRTGLLAQKKKTLSASENLGAAVLARAALVQEILTGGKGSTALEETLGAYARSWLERKLPWLESSATQQRYGEAIELHILPRLGILRVAAIQKSDLELWFAACKKANRFALRKYPEGTPRPAPAPYSADTINGWWRILKAMLQDAVGEKGLLVDPTMKVEPLPLRARTKERSNTLSAEELARLLAHAREAFPQWYAFLVLGFAIGARPGELRPLRWDLDLKLDTGELEISQSQRRDYLGPTKTKENRVTLLPPEVVQVLAWHREYLRKIRHPGADSGLVFPGAGGWRPWHKLSIVPAGASLHYLSPSALDRPLADMARAIKITRPITPRTMRRTLNDLMRVAGVNNLIVRSLTGHKSEEMQGTYSTIAPEERRAAASKVVQLFALGAPPDLSTVSSKVQVKVQVERHLRALSGTVRR